MCPRLSGRRSCGGRSPKISRMTSSVAEILSADGTHPRTRPAAKFALDRLAEPNLLTRDIGRMFLGATFNPPPVPRSPTRRRLQASPLLRALCVPEPDERYLDTSKGSSVLADKADGDVTFTRSSRKRYIHQTGPRILNAPAVVEPVVPRERNISAAWHAKHGPTDPTLQPSGGAGPRYLTSGAIPEFDRNVVNRLWAIMMGRGLVHPLDMHHTDNPPSNAELLDLMSRDFAASHYNIKMFLREVAPHAGLPAIERAARGYRNARSKHGSVDTVGRPPESPHARTIGVEYHAGAGAGGRLEDPRRRKA